jgi:hypothetical protein
MRILSYGSFNYAMILLTLDHVQNLPGDEFSRVEGLALGAITGLAISEVPRHR